MIKNFKYVKTIFLINRLISKSNLIEATNIEFLDEHRNILSSKKKNVTNIRFEKYKYFIVILISRIHIFTNFFAERYIRQQFC